MRDIEKQPGEILSGRQEGGMGAPWWFIGLRIQHCHYCGSGCCCGAASTPSLGPSACLGRGHQKKKKKKKKKKKRRGIKTEFGMRQNQRMRERRERWTYKYTQDQLPVRERTRKGRGEQKGPVVPNYFLSLLLAPFLDWSYK